MLRDKLDDILTEVYELPVTGTLLDALRHVALEDRHRFAVTPAIAVLMWVDENPGRRASYATLGSMLGVHERTICYVLRVHVAAGRIKRTSHDYDGGPHYSYRILI